MKKLSLQIHLAIATLYSLIFHWVDIIGEYLKSLLDNNKFSIYIKLSSDLRTHFKKDCKWDYCGSFTAWNSSGNYGIRKSSRFSKISNFHFSTSTQIFRFENKLAKEKSCRLVFTLMTFLYNQPFLTLSQILKPY